LGCYFGLAQNVTVSVGQEVASGDVIGSVGDTAEIEIAESPHLHFGVRKNGEWIDPLSLFE
jgi:murein DD-endopeptidase MepM/ murein hydrolase activator NlpD